MQISTPQNLNLSTDRLKLLDGWLSRWHCQMIVSCSFKILSVEGRAAHTRNIRLNLGNFGNYFSLSDPHSSNRTADFHTCWLKQHGTAWGNAFWDLIDEKFVQSTFLDPKILIDFLNGKSNQTKNSNNFWTVTDKQKISTTELTKSGQGIECRHHFRSRTP